MAPTQKGPTLIAFTMHDLFQQAISEAKQEGYLVESDVDRIRLDPEVSLTLAISAAAGASNCINADSPTNKILACQRQAQAWLAIHEQVRVAADRKRADEAMRKYAEPKPPEDWTGPAEDSTITPLAADRDAR